MHFIHVFSRIYLFILLVGLGGTRLSSFLFFFFCNFMLQLLFLNEFLFVDLCSSLCFNLLCITTIIIEHFYYTYRDIFLICKLCTSSAQFTTITIIHQRNINLLHLISRLDFQHRFGPHRY